MKSTSNISKELDKNENNQEVKESEFSVAQRETLASFIGPFSKADSLDEAGFDIQVILESKKMNTGTKYLYLTSAMNDDCKKFNNHLDKLFSQIKDLDTLRSLKRINDFCFNNPIYYNAELRSTYNHYLEKLGPQEKSSEVNSQKAMQSEAKKMISETCSYLKKIHKNIISEMNERMEQERIISPRTEWRKELNLPEDQLIPMDEGRLHMLAKYTGIASSELSRLYTNKTLYKLEDLVSYIIDYNHHRKSGLSIEEVLVLSPQQHSNLQGIHSYIKNDFLTLEEARMLKVDERRLLHESDDKQVQRECIKTLQNYRKTHNIPLLSSPAAEQLLVPTRQSMFEQKSLSFAGVPSKYKARLSLLSTITGMEPSHLYKNYDAEALDRIENLSRYIKNYNKQENPAFIRTESIRPNGSSI